MRVGIYLIICGLSLGYLIGLSESPVVSSVISSLLSVIVSLLICVSGLNIKSEAKELKLMVDVKPIAVFILFLTVGSSTGVYIRTHNFLGVTYISRNKEFNEEEYKKSRGSLYKDIQELKTALVIDNNNPSKLREDLMLMNSKSINYFLSKSPTDSLVLDFAKVLICE